MKKSLLIFCSAIVLVLFSGCNSSEEATTIIEDNKSFNELKAQSNKNYIFKTTDGKTIKFKVENDVLTSEELNGKYVMLNFWATWCAPCIREMPILTSFQEKFGDKLQIIGILIEKNKDPKELADFMEKYKMNFPVTIGEENYRIAKAFDDVKMFPESFVYAPDGKFLKKYIGEVNPSDLENLISK